MTASYPTSTKSFTTKADITDLTHGAHVNDLQEEVVAIETDILALTSGKLVRYTTGAGLADSIISEASDVATVASFIRSNATSAYRRYYHMPLFSADPGASGATWTPPDANTLGGWRMNAVGEILYFQSDIHADWNGNTNLIVEIVFEVNVDNSGGAAGDTVDLKLVCYYKGVGDTATKTQTVENANVVGASAQYKQFKVEYNVAYDAAQPPEVGDTIFFVLNLETDSSEVDDIILNDVAFYYQTHHIGIEFGDI